MYSFHGIIKRKSPRFVPEPIKGDEISARRIGGLLLGKVIDDFVVNL
jgi:hypothetical protein